MHVDDNFCRITLDTVLLPLTCLKLALDVDLRAFDDIFTGNFSDSSEKTHTMPLSFFYFLTSLLISPLLRCSQAEVSNGIPIGKVFHLGYLATGTNQNYFVYATSHEDHSTFSRRTNPTGKECPRGVIRVLDIAVQLLHLMGHKDHQKSVK
ncbi:hypothetical protein EDB98_112138 [Pseudomonas fluorescens]|nr:hypothetical protein EDB98_112138 [Pseudomonas fluorescens]